jgi:hypothetical protein
MKKHGYNPFIGRVDSDEQRRQLQVENSQLYERGEITRAEYARAYSQINEAYDIGRTRAAQERRRP